MRGWLRGRKRVWHVQPKNFGDGICISCSPPDWVSLEPNPPRDAFEHTWPLVPFFCGPERSACRSERASALKWSTIEAIAKDPSLIKIAFDPEMVGKIGDKWRQVSAMVLLQRTCENACIYLKHDALQ